MKWGVTAWVVAAMVAVAANVAAQEPSPMAEELFQEGKRLMAAGKYAEACIKLSESNRLDPAIGTLLNVAACHEKIGKTASAWAEFMAVAETAERKGQTERVTYARERVAALAKVMRKVIIQVKSPEAGMEIKLDDQVLGRGSWGTPLPLDPGEHRLSATAPSRPVWAKPFTVDAGPGTTAVEVPALDDGGIIRTWDPTGDGGVDRKPDTSRRTLGLVVGGAGVLALGTGVFFGVRSVLLDNQADRESSRADMARAQGDTENERIQSEASKRDSDSASSNRIIGVVAGGAGLAAIGVGIYFLVTAKEPSREAAVNTIRWTPLVGPNVGGASASFAF